MSSTRQNIRSISMPNQSWQRQTWQLFPRKEWTKLWPVSLTKCTDQSSPNLTRCRPICYFRAWWRSSMPIDTTRTICSWCKRDRKTTLTFLFSVIACTTTRRRLKIDSSSMPLRLTSSPSSLCQKAGPTSLKGRATCLKRTSTSCWDTRQTWRTSRSSAWTKQSKKEGTRW